MSESFDIAIVGARAAGAAAAIGFCRRGRSVVLVDPERACAAVGETLPPQATPLLQRLGVCEAVTAGGHLPAVCNESAWGSGTLTAIPFITTPYARGWHLDRRAFDAMLRARACDSGARSIEGRVCHFARDQQWRLTVETAEGRAAVAARWIVDATGRASWVATRLGVRRQQGRPLTAAAVTFDRERGRAPDPDRTTLVETASFGWFYTAPLPGSRRTAVCFTEPLNAPRTVDAFMKLTADAPHVQRRLAGYEPRGGVSLVAANSSALERATGDRWLAVGDAACAHDPVSSYGLVSALGTGLHGAEAVDDALNGRMAAITAYELRVRSEFDRYVDTLEAAYGMERRWPESPFWRRRAPNR